MRDILRYVEIKIEHSDGIIDQCPRSHIKVGWYRYGIPTRGLYFRLSFSTATYPSYGLFRIKTALTRLRADQEGYEYQILNATRYMEDFTFDVSVYDMPIAAFCRRCGESIESFYYFWEDVRLHMRRCKKPVEQRGFYTICWIIH